MRRAQLRPAWAINGMDRGPDLCVALPDRAWARRRYGLVSGVDRSARAGFQLLNAFVPADLRGGLIFGSSPTGKVLIRPTSPGRTTDCRARHLCARIRPVGVMGRKAVHMAASRSARASHVREKLSVHTDHVLRLPSVPDAAPGPAADVWGLAGWGLLPGAAHRRAR